MPQKNRRFTDFRRFPRSISVKSIVVVMSQRKDATRYFAIATTRRKSFSTNFGSTLYPPLFFVAMQGRQCFREVRTMPYRHRVGTHKHRTDPPVATIHIKFFFVAIWVWSSFASLSISRITFSERRNSIIIFLNHVSPINRSGMLKNCRFLQFFWSWFAVWYSRSPFFFPYLWPSGRPFLIHMFEIEKIQHGLDILLVICCAISQEVSARAVDDANLPIRQTCSALCSWLHVDYLA